MSTKSTVASLLFRSNPWRRTAISRHLRYTVAEGYVAAARNTSGTIGVSGALLNALDYLLELPESGRVYTVDDCGAVGLAIDYTDPDTGSERTALLGDSVWRFASGADPSRLHGYELGVGAVALALHRPVEANAFWRSWVDLLRAHRALPVPSPTLAGIERELLRASDELYYFLRYGDQAPDKSVDRLKAISIDAFEEPATALRPLSGVTIDTSPLDTLAAAEALVELTSRSTSPGGSISVTAPAGTAPVVTGIDSGACLYAHEPDAVTGLDRSQVYVVRTGGAKVARRNRSGKARVAGALVNAVSRTLTAGIAWLDVFVGKDGFVAKFNSRSRAGQRYSALGRGEDIYFDHGDTPEFVGYHWGVFVLAKALAEPSGALDFWTAWVALLETWDAHPDDWAAVQPDLIRVADEMYYLLAYGDKPIVSANLLLSHVRVHKWAGETLTDPRPVPKDALSSPADARALLASITGRKIGAGPAPTKAKARRARGTRAASATPLSSPGPAPATTPDPALGLAPAPVVVVPSFVGPQLDRMKLGYEMQQPMLLAGPKGTGKNTAVTALVEWAQCRLEMVEGAAGLLDLDFMGALLKGEWRDGPLTRGMRLAFGGENVVFFVDEVTHIPRHQLAFLKAVLNRKPAALLRAQGIDVPDAMVGDEFYAMQLPGLSEWVIAPASRLRIILAGNFGRQYAAERLDPALADRIAFVIDFNYLDREAEVDLLVRRTGLDRDRAHVLVMVAKHTRDMEAKREPVEGLSTRSLLAWAELAIRTRASTLTELFLLATFTWASGVFGRDESGRLRLDRLQGVMDAVAIQPGVSGAYPRGKGAL